MPATSGKRILEILLLVLQAMHWAGIGRMCCLSGFLALVLDFISVWPDVRGKGFGLGMTASDWVSSFEPSFLSLHCANDRVVNAACSRPVCPQD